MPNTSLLIDLTTGEAPATILASGLYADIDERIFAPGIIPYGVNSPLWSDNAYKTRYFALPGDSQIEFSRDGNWEFPANSVLVKDFHLDLVGEEGRVTRQIVETRLLVKVGDTFQWKGFSYRWNGLATDAELLASSHVETYTIVDPVDSTTTRDLEYLFPAPEDCGRCHTFGVGQVLGPQTSQLNGEFDYNGDGPGGVAHQLATLNRLGLFTQDIGSHFDDFPRLADPADESAPLQSRARSYLQANCAHCHLPGGLRRTEIDLRSVTPLEEMGIVDQISEVDDLGGTDRRILRPGDPENSVLLLRTFELGEQRMPPVASSVIDPVGTDVLRRWIASLGAPTAIEAFDTTPRLIELLDNYPNPFNATTTLRYTLAHAGPVALDIFDVTGRRIRRLVRAHLPSGEHTAIWDGLDAAGRHVSSGVYMAHLTAVPNSRLATDLAAGVKMGPKAGQIVDRITQVRRLTLLK